MRAFSAVLRDMSVLQALEKSLTWEAINQAAQPMPEPADRPSRGDKSHARNAVERHLQTQDILPKTWLIDELASEIERQDFARRTNGEALGVVLRLRDDARAGRAQWPRAIRDTAREVFVRATATSDQELSRAELVKLRVLARIPEVQAAREPEIRASFDRYVRAWRDVFRAFETRTRAGFSIPRLVRAIGALEDGMLLGAAAASATEDAEVAKLADLFADTVQHLVVGATEPASSPSP